MIKLQTNQYKKHIKLFMLINSSNNVVQSKVRYSNIELLRIIAQLMIILYHIYLYSIYSYDLNKINSVVQVPLHIGVPIFILISGYWGIKVSFKGIINLLMKTFFLSVPLFLIYIYIKGGNSHEFIKTFLFISHTPLWFIRTYFLFYLISPIINNYFQSANKKNKIYIILVLSFISIYIGTMNGDPSLSGGKNIINFMLIYSLGRILKDTKHYWERISVLKIFIIYITLNLFIVLTYYFQFDNKIGHLIYILSFSYCSPILIINAVLFFLLFAKINITNNCINSLASSVLSVYILHDNPLIFQLLIKPISISLYNTSDNVIISFIILFFLAIIIMLFCIVIDKLLTPLWNLSFIITKKIENKIDLKNYINITNN